MAFMTLPLMADNLEVLESLYSLTDIKTMKLPMYVQSMITFTIAS